MEKRYEAVDDWMTGIVDLGAAFNARAPKTVLLAVPAAAADVDQEYRKFARLDLSNM